MEFRGVDGKFIEQRKIFDFADAVAVGVDEGVVVSAAEVSVDGKERWDEMIWGKGKNVKRFG